MHMHVASATLDIQIVSHVRDASKAAAPLMYVYTYLYIYGSTEVSHEKNILNCMPQRK